MARAPLAVAALLLATWPAGAEGPAALGVEFMFVPQPALGRAERNERERQLDEAAKKALRELVEAEKEEQGRHGKKRDNWPAEARARLEALGREHWRALVEQQASRNSQADLLLVATAMQTRVMGAWSQKTGRHTRALEADEPADLTVLVEARWDKPDTGAGPETTVAFRLQPGPRLSPKLWVALTPVPLVKKRWLVVYHAATAEEPYWGLRYTMLNGNWEAAGNRGVELIDDLIAANLPLSGR